MIGTLGPGADGTRIVAREREEEKEEERERFVVLMYVLASVLMYVLGCCFHVLGCCNEMLVLHAIFLILFEGN